MTKKQPQKKKAKGMLIGAGILALLLILVVYLEGMEVTSYIAPIFLMLAVIMGWTKVKEEAEG